MKKTFLNLGKQPITNAFLSKEEEFKNEFLYNLSIGFDDETFLVSLMEFVEPQMMFNDSYAHRASMSITMRESFKNIATSIKDQFNPEKVMEIGSNDGVFVKNFGQGQIVAIEPCGNLAAITNRMGYKTYSDFWGISAAEKIVENHEKMDVIYSANTICHIEDLYDVFEGVSLALKDEGVFIFEDPSLFDVLNNTSYDQFYDEHVHLFSVISLVNLLQRHDLEIFKIENLLTHGGSNRIYVKKSICKRYGVHKSVGENVQKELAYGMDRFGAYEQFAKRVNKSRADLTQLMKEIKQQDKKIVSYGATYKSATIFNFCGINSDLIDYIIDTTPNKQGKFSPGMHIPIVSPEEGFDNSVDYAFLGAWNFREEIMKKENNFIKKGGKFITHVPTVRIL
jgi:SAM-dependent methyltransferase